MLSASASDDADWQWNDLFDNTIRYGQFSVSGTKYRNLINEGLRITFPTFTCTAPMTVFRNVFLHYWAASIHKEDGKG